MRGPLWLALCLCLTWIGCVAGQKVASPDTELNASIGYRSSGEAAVEGSGTAGGTVGAIGGGGDSVGLWLAILALALVPLAYPAGRYLRFGWGRWRGQSGTSSKGVEVCIKYSRRE